MDDIVHIVDDEEVIRDSLAWLIGSEDIACQTWARGEDFLADLPDTQPACVILDVRMGGLNGPAVFQQMLDAGSDIPVIFLTGHAEVPLAVEALKRVCCSIGLQALSLPHPRNLTCLPPRPSRDCPSRPCPAHLCQTHLFRIRPAPAPGSTL